MVARENQDGIGIKVVIILLVAHAFEHIYASGLPALFPIIRQEFGLSYTQIAFLATARELVRGFMQLPAGYLSDRTGSSNLFIYGFLGVSTATLLTGLSPVYHLIVLFQVISGISSSSFHPSTYALIVDHTPVERVGKVISVHTLGGSIGGILVFMLSGLFATYLGWRFTLVVWAIPGFFIAHQFLKIFKSTSFVKIEDKEREEKPGSDLKEEGSFGGSRRKNIIFFAAISMLMGMSGRALPIFLPLYFTEVYHKSIALSGFLASLYFIAAFPGLLLGGIMADRYNKLNIIIITGVFNSILLFVLARMEMPLFVLISLIVVIGLVKAMSMPSKNALAGLISSKKKRGVMFGLVFSAGFLGATLGTILYGYLADLFSLQSGLAFFGAVTLLTALVTLVYKFFFDNHEYRVKETSPEKTFSG